LIFDKNLIVFLAPEQLQWQAQELGVLIHFNIATYISNDGCTDQVVPNISLFNPYLLNTDNWVQTMVNFGAQYAVLVAKVNLNLLCEYLYFP
jgi:alpha-L-fucosidase